MGKKIRTGDPWMPGYKYGALLPSLTVNLIVTNVERSVQFYQDVLGANVHYHDIDFAAIRIGGGEFMLHADHTHEDHPWHPALTAEQPRGLGAQIRLLGIDPDETERRARVAGATVSVGTVTKGHGWREVCVRDPDGYEWGVGILVDPQKK